MKNSQKTQKSLVKIDRQKEADKKRKLEKELQKFRKKKK